MGVDSAELAGLVRKSMLSPFRSLALLPIAGFLGFGCSSPSSDTSETDPPKPTEDCPQGTLGCLGWMTCPPEMEPDPDGEGCREILSAEPCGVGSMAVLGTRECQPLGPAACPRDFAPSPSGWGCEPIMPARACDGASRDALGSTECVPVGDCDAPFPPAAATLFVDAAYNDDQVDATHFRSIGGAIDAADGGDTIAIESGTYAEGIIAKSGLTIVGRCAERVRLVGTGQEVWGLVVQFVKNVHLSGVTLEDHYEGVRAQSGGQVTLTDVVIEKPRSSGLLAWLPGSSIRAERVVIRETRPEPNNQSAPVVGVGADEGGKVELVDSVISKSWQAGATATNLAGHRHGSVLTIQHSIIRDTNLAEHTLNGAGVVVADNAHVDVVESAIVNTKRLGIVAMEPMASMSITSSVVQTTLEDTSGDVAAGAFVFDGATVSITDTTLRDHAQIGAVAFGVGSNITLQRSVVVGTRPGADGNFGIGAWADEAGKLTLDTTALVSNSYYGVGLNGAATSALMTNVLVQDTHRSPSDEFGRGISVEHGASATIDRATLVGNGDEGLFVRGENADGTRADVRATRLLVVDTLADGEGSLGTGIAVERGGRLDLDTAAILRSGAAGIVLNELLGDGGSSAEASLVNVVVRDTRGGFDAQVGTSTDVISGAGILSGGRLALRSSTIFGNLEFGVLVGGPAAEPLIEGCFIGSTAVGFNTGQYGHGIVAISAPSVIVHDTVVRSNTVGFAFDRSSGIIAGALVQNNAVGIHVQGDGFTLKTAAAPPDAPTPNTVIVTDDSRFVDNKARVGSGALPLPGGPTGPAGAPGVRPKPDF
jgi:hypothetical protein